MRTPLQKQRSEERQRYEEALRKREAEDRLQPTACSAGSMLRCYWAFIEYFPWKKSDFPNYDLWICSDADDARIFRQGWAARCRSLESLPNA